MIALGVFQDRPQIIFMRANPLRGYIDSLLIAGVVTTSSQTLIQGSVAILQDFELLSVVFNPEI